MDNKREKVKLPMSPKGRPILCFIAKNHGDIRFERSDDIDKVFVRPSCFALLYHGFEYELENGLAVVYADNYFFALDAILTLLDEENMSNYEHFIPVHLDDNDNPIVWEYTE